MFLQVVGLLFVCYNREESQMKWRLTDNLCTRFECLSVEALFKVQINVFDLHVFDVNAAVIDS